MFTSHKTFKLISIALGLVMIFIVGVVSILYNGRPWNIFSPCIEYEESLPIPSFLENQQIGFHAPMEYVASLTPAYGFCTATMRSIDRSLTINDPNNDNPYQSSEFIDGKINIQPVSSSSTFKVVGVFATNPTIMLSDESREVNLVLEDQSGTRSIIAAVYLDPYEAKSYYIQTSQDLKLPADFDYDYR